MSLEKGAPKGGANSCFLSDFCLSRAAQWVWGKQRIVRAFVFLFLLFAVCSGKIHSSAIEEQKNNLILFSGEDGIPSPVHFTLKDLRILRLKQIVVGNEVAQGAPRLLHGVGCFGASVGQTLPDFGGA